jgi:hypothetical protein
MSTINYLKLCLKSQSLYTSKISSDVNMLLRQLVETSILLGECNVAFQSIEKTEDFEDTFTRINLEGAVKILAQRVDDIISEIKKKTN